MHRAETNKHCSPFGENPLFTLQSKEKQRAKEEEEEKSAQSTLISETSTTDNHEC